jgi:hypothetical protein
MGYSEINSETVRRLEDAIFEFQLRCAQVKSDATRHFVPAQAPKLPSPAPKLTIRQLREIERQRKGDNTARYYAALTDPNRATFLGFTAVLNNRNLSEHGLAWRQACRLAEKNGGVVSLFTSSKK